MGHRWYRYVVRVRHDGGEVDITTRARNREVAIALVLNFERAPRRAIIFCKRWKRS